MLLSKAVTNLPPPPRKKGKKPPKQTKIHKQKTTKHQLFRFSLKVQAESSWGRNRVAPSHMYKSEQKQRIFLLGGNAYGYLEPLTI